MLVVRGRSFTCERPLICIPLTLTQIEDLETEIKAVRSLEPDIIEWRADLLKVTDYEEYKSILITLRETFFDIPLIFTYRTSKEGGKGSLQGDKYLELNTYVSDLNLVDLIDFEVNTGKSHALSFIKTAKQNNHKVILSYHNFITTPSVEELVFIYKSMESLDGDLLKVAVMPHNYDDTLTLINAASSFAKKSSKPIIAISMSSYGLISRVCTSLSKTCVTFASGLEASAPGQLNIVELRALMALFNNNELR